MDSEIFFAVLTLIFGGIAAGAAYFLLPWLKRKASTTASEFDDILLTAIEKPLIITILAWSVYIALTHFGILPETIAGFSVDQFVHAFFILIGAWIVSSFSYDLLRTYGAAIAEKTGTDIDDRLFAMLEIIAKYLIWFAALLLLLDNFNIDITPLLAGAGIAGIAIALAAQDILSNFFGGAIITMDKPFRIGDRIMFENHFGDIISIGPRSTRLKTLDNQIVTIPNSRLTSNIVINYAQPDFKMKVRIPFSVAYGSDMSRVKEILMEIAGEAAERTSWVLTDPAPSVYFLEFGESSLNGQLILWTGNYDNVWDVQDFINSRIDYRFKNDGIEIPFRQVDLRVR
ncbi:MAG: Small-conductance mechanosensitive channel MscMJ [Euryarchaeota archaeon ADurb.BinA087]|nr:MAG: Small-conductance mechanosensitive channel MscMJ [Euryarchaeota archaeon ADurb.BinA087]HPX72644.1 mechanosensitive ion channel [Methanoregulaceae archaeon]HQA81665.1 mechanosensitive ion channel [Methanoregulaceae archaeon]